KGKYRNTVQFGVDIFNVGNFLDPSWGRLKTVNAGSLLVPTNVSSLVAGGTVRPTFQLATDRTQLVQTTFRDVVSVASTYSMQFSLRYIFNN
ncbi:MAG TPA: hypothetical protein VI461_04380, partial [Chitinophagaceae bacterium]|nr:hypothetical protein [Chitinophagaceae bacterium]